ncbi:MAG: N-6 DNA methylase [Bacilli bacterium]|nr:N-6 DNA methylase [Bacilli bacterium]
MIRTDIINRIGREYLTSNIENDEFSYNKSLTEIGESIGDYVNSDSKKVHQYVDLRFANNRLTILVETKDNFDRWNRKEIEQQLQQYVYYENVLTGNKIIAILTNTIDDRIRVWYGDKITIDLDDYIEDERKIKTFEEYENIFFSNTNDKLKVIQNTYDLNELLHKYGINEKIRSQFVGTCLLALKNGLSYSDANLTTTQIIAGIKENLEKLLNNNLNKAIKLVLLDKNVLNSQDVKDLTDNQLKEILSNINKNILPYINAESTQGQDLLSLFFTTFNKYVGKADKNQAFTPDHITQFMCHVLDVNRHSKVLDPCCGSGSFLVRAMTEAMNDCDTKEERDNIKAHNIYGIEYEDIAFGLSTTNMLIHGDGNSNIIQGSMFDNEEWIKNANIDIVLMNPPYNATRKQSLNSYVKTWNKKITTDPSKGLHYVYYIANLLKKGKLAVLLPMQCAIGASGDVKTFKEKMLEENTLEAVFSLPSDMFYPGANAVACCMVFTLGVRHNKDFKTFFGYYKDDGFEKKKNLGRVEKYENAWKQKESEWLKLYKNKIEKIGYSVLKHVDANDEWLAEAYMETDYRNINQSDFQSVLNQYIGYIISNGGKK